jgi:hypothetical protein
MLEDLSAASFHGDAALSADVSPKGRGRNLIVGGPGGVRAEATSAHG